MIAIRWTCIANCQSPIVDTILIIINITIHSDWMQKEQQKKSTIVHRSHIAKRAHTIRLLSKSIEKHCLFLLLFLKQHWFLVCTFCMLNDAFTTFLNVNAVLSVQCLVFIYNLKQLSEWNKKKNCRHDTKLPIQQFVNGELTIN